MVGGWWWRVWWLVVGVWGGVFYRCGGVSFLVWGWVCRSFHPLLLPVWGCLPLVGCCCTCRRQRHRCVYRLPSLDFGIIDPVSLGPCPSSWGCPLLSLPRRVVVSLISSPYRADYDPDQDPDPSCWVCPSAPCPSSSPCPSSPSYHPSYSSTFSAPPNSHLHRQP